MWGAGVDLAGEYDDPRSVMDVAPTIAYFLGVRPPAQSMGQVLAVEEKSEEDKPLAIIIPAYNEAENPARHAFANTQGQPAQPAGNRG